MQHLPMPSIRAPIMAIMILQVVALFACTFLETRLIDGGTRIMLALPSEHSSPAPDTKLSFVGFNARIASTSLFLPVLRPWRQFIHSVIYSAKQPETGDGSD
jgi:hypothetical protein